MMCANELLRDQLDGLLMRAGEVETAARMEASFPDNISRRSTTLEKSVTPMLGSANSSPLSSSPSPVLSPVSAALQRRKAKKTLNRRGRFRTQPITFTEIKEVDEEGAMDVDTSHASSRLTTDGAGKARSAHDLRRPSLSDHQRRRSSLVGTKRKEEEEEENVAEEAADELGSLSIGHLANGKESLIIELPQTFGVLSRFGHRGTLL